MERDKRLTGYLRGQTDNAEAPPGFELNNPWKVREVSMDWSPTLLRMTRWRNASNKDRSQLVNVDL